MSAREGQLGNLTQRGHLLRAGKWPQLYLGPAELSQRPNELEKRFFRPASLLAGPEHGRTTPLPAIDRSVFTYRSYGIFLTRAFEDVATRAWSIDFCHDFQPIVSPGATGARDCQCFRHASSLGLQRQRCR